MAKAKMNFLVSGLFLSLILLCGACSGGKPSSTSVSPSLIPPSSQSGSQALSGGSSRSALGSDVIQPLQGIWEIVEIHCGGDQPPHFRSGLSHGRRSYIYSFTNDRGSLVGDYSSSAFGSLRVEAVYGFQVRYLAPGQAILVFDQPYERFHRTGNPAQSQFFRSSVKSNDEREISFRKEGATLTLELKNDFLCADEYLMPGDSKIIAQQSHRSALRRQTAAALARARQGYQRRRQNSLPHISAEPLSRSTEFSGVESHTSQDDTMVLTSTLNPDSQFDEDADESDGAEQLIFSQE